MYKGVVKVTYDRGYAVQTKSLLLESTTTAMETLVQLIEGLGLRGTPADYALEERNKRTGGIWPHPPHTHTACITIASM